jgi:hypothetical protein
MEDAERLGRRAAVRVLYEHWKTGQLEALRLALPAILAYYSLPVGEEELEGWFGSLLEATLHFREVLREAGKTDGLPEGEKLALVRRFIGEAIEPEYG